MKSLALVVALIILVVIVLGALSLITFVRTPKSNIGVSIAFFINAAGIVSGTWFVLLDIGLGARVIGGCVATASAVSAIRLLRSN